MHKIVKVFMIDIEVIIMINKILSIKPTKLYFGKSFYQVKKLLEENGNNNISDMGSFITIIYDDCRIFLDEMYQLDVFSNLSEIEIAKKVDSIEKEINNVISGFKFDRKINYN